MQAAENPKGVDELARKLYGSCTFIDEGKVIISDEVNGKQRQCPNRDSALIGAGMFLAVFCFERLTKIAKRTN